MHSAKSLGTGAGIRHVALTGLPGSGKTTLVKKICEELQRRQVSINGFYTEELRQNGRRVGFDIVTLNGRRAPLARVVEPGICQSLHRQTRHKVGQYCVLLKEFEQEAIPILKQEPVTGITVIDEIGKMELLSKSFEDIVTQILTGKTSSVLATIPISRLHPNSIVEVIRKSPTVRVFTVTVENREKIISEIIEQLLLMQ